LDRIKIVNQNKDKRVKPDKEKENNTLKSEEKEESKPEKIKKDPKKIRCNFWPNCKTSDCPFVHPAESVTL
jgi:hypothetical protein